MYTHMLPADALNKISHVTIRHLNDFIYSFSFFDKEWELLWEIGEIKSGFNKETVDIAENEVIVGVVAKLLNSLQSCYTDF